MRASGGASCGAVGNGAIEAFLRARTIALYPWSTGARHERAVGNGRRRTAISLGEVRVHVRIFLDEKVVDGVGTGFVRRVWRRWAVGTATGAGGSSDDCHDGKKGRGLEGWKVMRLA